MEVCVYVRTHTLVVLMRVFAYYKTHLTVSNQINLSFPKTDKMMKGLDFFYLIFSSVLFHGEIWQKQPLNYVLGY